MLKSCGKNVYIDFKVYIKYPWLVEIGNDTSVNRNVEFYPAFHGNKTIAVGSNVYIAPGVVFHASGHDVYNFETLVGENIVVEDNVWIGANSVILPGVTIHSGSVVAAGSVITKDVPGFCLVGGVPAKAIRSLEQE